MSSCTCTFSLAGEVSELCPTHERRRAADYREFITTASWRMKVILNFLHDQHVEVAAKFPVDDREVLRVAHIWNACKALHEGKI